MNRITQADIEAVVGGPVCWPAGKYSRLLYGLAIWRALEAAGKTEGSFLLAGSLPSELWTWRQEIRGWASSKKKLAELKRLAREEQGY